MFSVRLSLANHLHFFKNDKIINFEVVNGKNSKGDVFKITKINCLNQNNIVIIDPKNISFYDQIKFIKTKIHLLLAINSYLWPISRMLKKRMVGIHYLDSGDGHQFIDEDAFIITPSLNSFKKIKNSVLAVENIDYNRIYSNPLMIEYRSKSIYEALIKGYNFKDY